jgi:hypothetical protein
MSFWDYLRDELTVADFDTAQEIKRERVTNFLAVPSSLEKVSVLNHSCESNHVTHIFIYSFAMMMDQLMGFGYVVCLDSFLYTFTILPLRFALAFYHYLQSIYVNVNNLWHRNGGR